MKRYVVLIGMVLAVSVTAFNALAQDDETPAQKMQRQRREEQARMAEKYRNMSPQEREKFMDELKEQRKRFQNMSDEERAKLRAQMRERSGSRNEGLSREQQLAKIAGIEKQLTKLKKSVESIDPEARSKIMDLSETERAKLQEKISKASNEQQIIIRDIEQQLATLKGSRRPQSMSEARLSELRAIHKLALREKAAQTADRLDKLIMGYQRGSVSRDRQPREDQPRQRRERPVREEITR